MHRLQHVSWIVAAGVLSGCYRAPAEDTLIQNVRLHRVTFDKLVALADGDRGYFRVSAGRVPPVGMVPQRFAHYSELFRALRIENGLTRNAAYPGALFVIVSSEVPIGGKSRSEGYVHSQVPLAPVSSSLQVPSLPFEIHRGSGNRIAFRRLDDSWYLFCDAAW